MYRLGEIRKTRLLNIGGVIESSLYGVMRNFPLAIELGTTRDNTRSNATLDAVQYDGGCESFGSK